MYITAEYMSPVHKSFFSNPSPSSANQRENRRKRFCCLPSFMSHTKKSAQLLASTKFRIMVAIVLRTRLSFGFMAQFSRMSVGMYISMSSKSTFENATLNTVPVSVVKVYSSFCRLY